MRRSARIALLALALIASACSPSPTSPTPFEPLSAGSPAPDFALRALDAAGQGASRGGDTISLQDFRGRPVVLNFWASWCGPCRQEMPELIAAHQAHQADGLVVLAIDNTQLDVVDDVRAFADEFQLPFPVLLDERGEAIRAYAIVGLPTSVFVDAGGAVRNINVGPLTRDALDGYLAEILPAP